MDTPETVASKQSRYLRLMQKAQQLDDPQLVERLERASIRCEALATRAPTTLAEAVHPYPTMGEINKRVAGSYFSPKIFSDKVQKGLKFFFNLKGRACFMNG